MLVDRSVQLQCYSPSKKNPQKSGVFCPGIYTVPLLEIYHLISPLTEELAGPVVHHRSTQPLLLRRSTPCWFPLPTGVGAWVGIEHGHVRERDVELVTPDKQLKRSQHLGSVLLGLDRVYPPLKQGSNDAE